MNNHNFSESQSFKNPHSNNDQLDT